jgi:hypothetical protein
MTFEPPKEIEDKPKFNGLSFRLGLERLETFKSRCLVESLDISKVLKVLIELFLEDEEIQNRVIMGVRQRWG